jgi:formylglycine-generating enzyme required for sulfatase activity
MAFKLSWAGAATFAAASVLLVAARSTRPSRSPLSATPADAASPGAQSAAGAQLSEVSSSAPTNEMRPACGESMANAGGYCIDKYEAYLVRRKPDGERERHPYFERPAPGEVYEARNEAGAFPQAYISRVEAAAACANAGKRLCTLAEWRRACEGPSHAIYPYGNARETGRCNTDKVHLLTMRFGADARRWSYEDFNDPTLDQEPGFLARAGAFERCVGELGVFDLVGNLHEWVSDDVDRALVAELGLAPDPSDPNQASAGRTLRSWQPWQPGNGVFMGGFYSTREENGAGCGFITIAHEPGYHDYSTGFRCCADAGD